ncbi:DUF5011 domain-containing protein [Haloplasma contractile]|uniref:Chitinase protein n=1 Tax=Haloplasma contractile SSD-17B TaxID=1033810 RepID=U2EFD5_9MOLU|nr:DUF5011 domain-containing protein [Haloplasma contractile]ERJ13648.1 chitinase protein [Haloplasma contractile SSD-17B]
MKQKLIISLLFLAVVLVGCNNTEVDTTDTNTTEASEEITDAIFKGVEDVTITVDSTFDSMNGITAEDYDGTDLTDSVTIEGTVDTATAGDYDLTYKVTGASNNEVTTTRTVIVETSTPVITVVPETIEIYAGDDLDLFIGVTVSGYNSNMQASIKDNGGFDKNTPGTYTITYEATDSTGNSATATRNVIVNEAIVNYVLEVQYEYDSNWGSKTLPISGENIVRADADYDLGDPTQVTLVINESDSDITVTTSDIYGEAAIIDAHGKVIEGRDGANGKLVNKDYPSRTQNAGPLDANAYGVDMVVPAGGFVIVAPNEGGSFDEDGRSFIVKNVIFEYGNVVSIYADDDSEILTNYVDRAPTFNYFKPLEVVEGTTADQVDVLEGLVITDDNGTFDPSDDIDIPLTDAVVRADANYDPNTLADYTWSIAVVDSEGNTRAVTRTVTVIPSTPDAPTIEINGNRVNFNPNDLNTDLLEPTPWNTDGVVIYDSNYTGNLSDVIVKWSVVTVVDGNGTIIETRDAYGNEFNETNTDIDNPGTADGWDAQDMLEGLTVPDGGYVVVFLNGSDARQFGLDNARVYGREVTFYYLYPTIVVNNTIREVDYVNPDVINNDGITAFTSEYTGDLSSLSLAWSILAILDENGDVILSRDWSNQYDANNPNGTPAEGWSGGDMLAGIEIPENGVLLVFPNDGANGPDSPRTFGKDHLLGYGIDAEIFSLNYYSSVTASGETIKAVVNPATPVTGAMIFTSEYGATIDFSLGWGVLVVVGEDGKVDLVRDALNAKQIDELHPDATNALTDITWTSGDYTNGVEIPANGYVLVFNGTDARAYGSGLRTYDLVVDINIVK